jgi:type I restriction-modification system DNA methylase subunit
MTTEEISQKLEAIPATLTGSAWGFAFLKCYQGKDSILPQAILDRVQEGSANFVEDKGTEILWKKRIYFHWVAENIRTALEEAKGSESLNKAANKPMFIVIASPKEIAAYDTSQEEDILIPREELPTYAYFFLPFAGKKKITVPAETHEIDLKATRQMAVLFDEIRKTNVGFDSHDLNVFLARLLFCFFAEDTGIFEDDIFTSSIASNTALDGSDLSEFMTQVFHRFATQDTSSFREEFRKFKYVNGGLFEEERPVPTFTQRSRKLLLKIGMLDWKAINPDIFGSMFQAVIDPEKRHELGMHYTSRANIMKVINPLFMDDLRDDFEKAKDNKKKLEDFHNRLSNIRIFDPACGSGNFLILAYEQLRELEMDVIQAKGKEIAELFPRIQINQFYGIEIDDIAHELARLSLWIKEHQMNLRFHQRFLTSPAALPLHEGAHISLDNATRCDWTHACPRSQVEGDGKLHVYEIYVLGNPPYVGARSPVKTQVQKQDMAISIGDIRGINEIDYVSCWFFKAADYISGQNVSAGFVSTNSICQGEQATMVWNPLLSGNSKIEIGFAHTSFLWKNSAINNPGVTCIVVGVRNKSTRKKQIFRGNECKEVEVINEYLEPLPYVWVWDQGDSISGLPSITFGNMPNDGGNLLLNDKEKRDLIGEYPEAGRFIKRFCGADEFLSKSRRYCLWIENRDLSKAGCIAPIIARIDECRQNRLNSDRKATRKLATIAHQFGEIRHQNTESIIFPRHTSEKRDYIPLGFFDGDTIIGDSALAVYNATPWIFGILSSRMHMAWTKLIAGRIKSDPRYSTFVYNTFPIPSIANASKAQIEEVVFKIIDIREHHSEMTYADMYDPKKMPKDLLAAHRELDGIVDRCYREMPFTDTNERLVYLIALYKKMTGQQ